MSLREEVGMSVHCGDCGASSALPVQSDPPALLRSVKEFVAEHSECSFSVTIVLPRQQGAERANES
jgi:hypothetical protein